MSKFDLTRADYCPETLAVRAGQERSQFGEHSEALYLTSSFVFKSASQAAKRFSGEEEGNVYARFSNPTVTMFEERLAALEGAEDCVATASGLQRQRHFGDHGCGARAPQKWRPYRRLQRFVRCDGTVVFEYSGADWHLHYFRAAN